MPVATSRAAPNAAPAGADSDVAAAAAGDRRAFERIYRAHIGRVFALCVRMCGDRALAEELTQDVFVRAWGKLGSFRGESAFSTWLHRLAVNVVLNARKSEGRHRARHESMDEEGADEVEGTIPIAPGEMLDVDAAVARLPAGARRVFVLHDVEGYKHEEIAEMSGVTVGACKAQLHRARMLLRRSLRG
jgi:RNA polymerase sigma-70 factor (ECF subfamily)